MPNGVLIIDKPSGWTSHDVVAKVRGILHERSVGHLGTLDPMATGLLPLVTGTMTRLAQFYTGAEKTYEGTIRFGFATDTYDADGEAAGPSQPVQLNLAPLRALAQEFEGTLLQTPPPFSAKKIQGVPAYKLARKNIHVKLEEVAITVHSFKVLSIHADCCNFSASVSSGTYIRSIAHAMGQRMGCGAHLTALRRTAFAEFRLPSSFTCESTAAGSDADLAVSAESAQQDVRNDAHTLEELAAAVVGVPALELYIHPRRYLPAMPAVTANCEAVAYLRSGRAVNLPEMSGAPLVKVFDGQTDLISIARRIAGTLFRPQIVFPKS